MSLVLEHVGLQVGAEPVISDVSLELARGTTAVLLGPTLSGKTTLMRLMAGLDRPTSGRVLVDGRDMAHVPVRRRSVAMVYQQFVNYPSLTVYENIASPLRVARVERGELDRRVREAARVLRLEALLDRLPAQLSGGQQQRTAIARALVKRAELVLLDEPLANLDYKLREELREELPRIFGESGAILVYATTEPAEALLLRGRTATLSEGRVIQFGDTAAVYRMPDHIDSARVFSDPPLNELAVRKEGAVLLLPHGRRVQASGQLAALSDGDYHLAFRVEHAGLASQVEHAGLASQVEHAGLGECPGEGMRFAGTVLATQLSGSESFVHVDVGAASWVCLVRGVHEWQPGAAAEVRIDPDGLFVFAADGRRHDSVAASPRVVLSA